MSFTQLLRTLLTGVIVIAGVPFRTPGSTNVLHVVRLVGDEVERAPERRLGQAAGEEQDLLHAVSPAATSP